MTIPRLFHSKIRSQTWKILQHINFQDTRIVNLLTYEANMSKAVQKELKTSLKGLDIADCTDTEFDVAMVSLANWVRSEANNMPNKAHLRLEFYKNKVRQLQEENKLNQDDLMQLAGFKDESKKEAKKSYQKDNNPLVNFDSHESFFIFSLISLGTLAPIDAAAALTDEEPGLRGATAIGTLISSFWWAPVGVVGIGILAAIRAIKNHKAKKEAFEEIYSDKLKQFVNIVAGKS